MVQAILTTSGFEGPLGPQARLGSGTRARSRKGSARSKVRSGLKLDLDRETERAHPPRFDSFALAPR